MKCIVRNRGGIKENLPALAVAVPVKCHNRGHGMPVVTVSLFVVRAHAPHVCVPVRDRETNPDKQRQSRRQTTKTDGGAGASALCWFPASSASELLSQNQSEGDCET